MLGRIIQKSFGYGFLLVCLALVIRLNGKPCEPIAWEILIMLSIGYATIGLVEVK